ncbi:hypothetical protein BH24DEI2_BH24DEI2_10790 [soil metagenome]
MGEMGSGGEKPLELSLPLEEPYFGPWRIVTVAAFVRALEAFPTATGKTKIVVIDGRSANGKSTLAALIHRAVPGSALVHTDDVAWHHSFFGWTALLVENVLEPARAGQAVNYRPPAWVERNREGAIEVPSKCSLLILEGVGAARRELMYLVDVVIWVQADIRRAKTRGLIRDGDKAEATAFWGSWMAAELPFLADQRPWERADFVVSGMPQLEHDPTSQIVIAV